jgi:hypothetical protein
MKLKISLLVCTASLFVAFPVLAQGNRQDGVHGHHGNNSDHSGHDNDGNSADHRQDGPHGFGSRNLVLANPSATAAVATAMTSVTSTLKSGSMTTPAGAFIPASAQSRAYALLSADPTQSASTAEISAALATAGPEASAIVPSLMRSFSGLAPNPAQLPSVIASYNEFTKAASNRFITNPPPEFVALHAVLAQLTSAAHRAK